MTRWLEFGLAPTKADTWTSVPSEVREPAQEIRRLRARANRSRALAASLFDPRVIGAVKSCARELEKKANRIEARAARQARRNRRRGYGLESEAVASAAPA